MKYGEYDYIDAVDLRQAAHITREYLETLSDCWHRLTRHYGKNLVEMMMQEADRLEQQRSEYRNKIIANDPFLKDESR